MAQGEQQKVREYFCSRYLAVLGVPYLYQPGKDDRHLKDLLEVFDLEQLRQMIDRLLTTSNPWIADGRRTIGILYFKANELAQQIQPKKSSGAPRY